MQRRQIENEINELKQDFRLRTIKTNNNELLNFSSNDYLGILKDEKIFEEFYSNLNFEEYKLSSASSRLIDGSYSIVMSLENEVERIYKKPCLVYNSGFDANSSLIETFFNKESLIITDRLNHASIYDGCINSGAKILRYNHLDTVALERLLEKYSNEYKDILVVTESVYSMDGDIADIEAIVKLKERYSFQLMLDEAHSYGVYGYGIAYNKNLVKDIDFLVIPLGKGGASIGAYVICDELYKQYLINKSRKFIYSTALPPINNLWNLYILKNMLKFSKKIENMEKLVKFSLNELKRLEIETSSNSHIISIIIGENNATTKLSEVLKQKGYLAYSIKEPTVPKNTARLRISLTANMDKAELKTFFLILKEEISKVKVI
ncbi:MAG: aminotransferase class I/II-fold pyridoxal phosphate-dependent enzyme [Fusobacterium gastrosuis]|uniref:aminotransferase class I/II-fold pyridoxal phosphate-dependent enzyme n=1 Tax=Fusobacterium gastrosuis TaxID=1755100 RepID=UPI002A922254|nr:aminotransferase class I/II-fold pyridoxal phosphate-dependent enzyme [Fusobacteriaceae bacterium]MDY5794501.1 aminotransferase class I/II-fold pyridoxal phosphate-dependent enzyme [Fusobacterium gastrosuis]